MSLLSRVANVDIKVEDNITHLHIAAKTGYVDVAENLLNHCASINYLRLEEEYTPLHFASEENNEEVVKLFVNRRADINARTNNNLTPIYMAIKSNCKTALTTWS